MLTGNTTSKGGKALTYVLLDAHFGRNSLKNRGSIVKGDVYRNGFPGKRRRKSELSPKKVMHDHEKKMK